MFINSEFLKALTDILPHLSCLLNSFKIECPDGLQVGLYKQRGSQSSGRVVFSFDAGRVKPLCPWPRPQCVVGECFSGEQLEGELVPKENVCVHC